MYAEFIKQADQVSDEQHHGNHTPISAILRDKTMKETIFVLLKMMHQPFTNADREEVTLKFIEKLFLDNFRVDISQFRDDHAELWEKMGDGGIKHYIKMMFVYTMRNKQGFCAKCGMKIFDTMFGALGFESNHLADDNAKSDADRIKWFEVSRRNFDRHLNEIIFELCKTRLECWRCHNRYGPEVFHQLPAECYGTYDFPPRPYCDVQKTEECECLYNCIKGLIDRAKVLSYADVVTAIYFDTFLDPRDALLFDEEWWDRAPASARKKKLKRAYLQGEKRLAGGCWMCGALFANSPLREFCGLDGHHVRESKKLFNPSAGDKKDLDDARDEHRKCFPLCKCCHMRVTHDEDFNRKFLDKLWRRGYRIGDADGYIYAFELVREEGRIFLRLNM